MSIVIIGMLDEREESLRLLKNYIKARGHKTALMDISIGKGAINPTLQADISCDELARAGGSSLLEVKGIVANEEKKATSVMAEGLRNKLLELHQDGELQGVVAVAGLTGRYMIPVPIGPLSTNWRKTSIPRSKSSRLTTTLTLGSLPEPRWMR